MVATRDGRGSLVLKSAKKSGCALLSVAAVLCYSQGARAEVTLAESNGWEVFSDGRISAFLMYANGDGVPPRGMDVNGNPVDLPTGSGLAESEAGSDAPPSVQGNVEGFRVKSGFVGNVFGFGVRRSLTDTTTLKGYFHIHAALEPPDRRKYLPILTDFREAYLELSGPWGSLLGGRSLALFSRGATEITFLYGFNYGMGHPGSVDNPGPGLGHIGFGVLANGFAPGFKYTTPSVGGLELAVGVYDPAGLVGAIWERTKYPRPEAELTYHVEAGSFLLHLFANGAWQKLYQNNSTESETVAGAGYGGRVEVGPVHLGLAGHYGKGLGLNFALQPSNVTYAGITQDYALRTFDGYYAQLQVALGKLDLMAGWGITRVKLLDSDRVDQRDDDNDPATPSGNDFDDDGDAATPVGDDDEVPGAPDVDPLGLNPLKHQMGISAGLAYHFADQLHLGLDFFRADYRWYLGETKQIVNFVNVGMTVQW